MKDCKALIFFLFCTICGFVFLFRTESIWMTVFWSAYTMIMAFYVFKTTKKWLDI